MSALEDTLRQDDYLYSLKVTKGMNKVLSAYNGGGKLKDYTLYAVEEDGGEIVLKEVAESGK